MSVSPDQGPVHVSEDVLLAKLSAASIASPRDDGTVSWMCIRPSSNQREEVTTARFTISRGMEGDRWVDGIKLNSDGQISVMNSRVLSAMSVDRPHALLAGDNLVVDLDLSTANLSAGDQVAVGDEVIFEVTPKPHNGCAKFQKRFGKVALAWTKEEPRRRGIYFKVVRDGTISAGDRIKKIPTPNFRSNSSSDFTFFVVVGATAVVVIAGIVVWSQRRK